LWERGLVGLIDNEFTLKVATEMWGIVVVKEGSGARRRVWLSKQFCFAVNMGVMRIF
jgi:hypothetical protein